MISPLGGNNSFTQPIIRVYLCASVVSLPPPDTRKQKSALRGESVPARREERGKMSLQVLLVCRRILIIGNPIAGAQESQRMGDSFGRRLGPLIFLSGTR